MEGNVISSFDDLIKKAQRSLDDFCANNNQSLEKINSLIVNVG